MTEPMHKQLLMVPSLSEVAGGRSLDRLPTAPQQELGKKKTAKEQTIESERWGEGHSANSGF